MKKVRILITLAYGIDVIFIYATISLCDRVRAHTKHVHTRCLTSTSRGVKLYETGHPGLFNES